MRLVGVCASLCIAFSMEASADSWMSQGFSPSETSFIHRTRDFTTEFLQTDSFWGLTDNALGGTNDPPAHFPPPPKPSRQFTKVELCSTAASVAEANRLPVPFFTNLIHQESGFKPHAVSPAGAQGIAQFMPRVAASYGLHDPFDPIKALAASGKFLAELMQQFGNLGLAAAAYNAGPKRVQNWMAKRGKLPTETRNYVRNITGRPAEHWVRRTAKAQKLPLPAHARCPETATMVAQAGNPSVGPGKKTHVLAKAKQSTVMTKTANVAAEKPAGSTLRESAAKRASMKQKPVLASAKPVARTAAVKAKPAASKNVRLAAVRQ
jgi:hypothetical protein